ncbi:DUF560 domain-containing protein [Sulfitobacter albidus]|uniref:DUF560 domain-containing protein n=1 Tax=Sulfitobacter albidus TaxID=2829501 RepID=A0A975JGH7_9RHOB|nr:porin family protein [Sulfitobacter albidus]QUJ77771.1 DUF560 domain-containing protein [Sulfitobacter albidus]
MRAETLAEARVLRAAGDYERAVEILRGLLRARPDDIAIREELGYALLLDGQIRAARYQFTLLDERVDDPALRALYRGVLRRIDAERPTSVSLIFELEPTSNLNNGTDARTVRLNGFGTGDVTPESRRTAGWRARIGLQGFVRRPLGTQGRVTFDWRVQREIFSEVFDPSDEVELGLGYTHTPHWGEWGVRGVALHHDGDLARYQYYGISTGSVLRVGPKQAVDGQLTLARLDFPPGDARGGPRVSVEAGWRFSPDPATSLRFGARVGRVRSERIGLRHTAAEVNAQVSRAFRGGLEIGAALAIGQRIYARDLGFGRRDTIADVSATLVNSRYSVRGVVPKLTCSLGRTRSNVAVFDTTRKGCGISLSRRF